MKKLIALAISACMLAASLVGCSGSSSSTNSTSDASGETVWQPSRTINIDVAFAAGGDTDYNARMYAEKLGDILGTTVIVNNVTGSGGAAAAEEVKNSEPDGYTVLFTQTSFFLSQVSGVTDYGLEAFELSAIGGCSSGWAIIVPASSGITTVDELVQKSLTETIVFGGTTGAQGSMIGAQFNQAGANFNVVDYGSATDKVAGLLSGDIDVSVIPILTAQPYIESGDFVCLGLCEAERNECFPDIPTITEQGYDVVCPSYYFFAFPKDTPDYIVETFTDACEQIFESEDYQTTLRDSYNQVPVFYRGAEAEQILNDFAATAQSVKDLM